MRIFDFNVAMGRAANPIGGAFDTPRQLYEEMDRLGIHEALVYHHLAAEGDVRQGNERLIELVHDAPRLHPCWVMTPDTFAEMPDIEPWVVDAIDMGVVAVRVFPHHSLFRLGNSRVKKLVTILEQAALPLLLDFGPHHWSQSVVPWPDIEALCLAHDELRVVLLGATIGDIRELVPLLGKMPHLTVDTHALMVPNLHICMGDEGILDCMVFSTGMPTRAGECAIAHLLHSGLSQEEMELVAGATARELLGLEDPFESEESSEKEDGPLVPRTESGTAHPGLGPLEVFERIHARNRPRCLTTVEVHAAPSSERVIDVHCHYGSWERVCIPVSEPTAIIECMDRAGVDVIVGSSYTAVHGEQRLGNRETAEIIRSHPDRLFGYAVINPHFPAEIEAELSACFDVAVGFVGLKLHCGLHAVQLHDTRYEAALCYANAHELPVLVHGGGKDRWEEVCSRYPRASFIIAHACAWDGMSQDTAHPFHLARDIPNLHVDVAGSPAYRGALQALVALVGVHKVLYGSDFSMFDLAFELGRVTLSPLDDATKSAICGGNARKLFKRIA